MKCAKCQATESLERHHVYPRCHFGSDKRNNVRLVLCSDCHFKIERIIEAVEMYVGDVPLGTRHKLTTACYQRIHRRFLKTSKLITVDFA
jgi:hypothetical protein